MAVELLGREVNESLRRKISVHVSELRAMGVNATLCIIRVGDNPSDISYENSATKRCGSMGIEVRKILLSNDVPQEKLLSVINEMNSDTSVHGVLLFRPLPKHLDQSLIENALTYRKDVDCMTDLSMSGVFAGKKIGFPPCTAQACMEILDHYKIDCEGKRAVIIGRSLVVGKPAAMMLLSRNATVTICHTKTLDLPLVAREADILFVASGHAKMITKEYVRPGQIVIDVGINMDCDGKLCGDVDYSQVSGIVDMITPVPRGVGPVTATVLAEHVVEAAVMSLKK